jgi:predicted alpha-1,2-mannosidase
MIKKLFGLLLFVALFSSCSKKNELVDYVDPFIGTGGHGHTYPGASLPFGMVQLSPDTRLEGWDGCSGYHFSDSIIYGFSHTHLSGTGCSDYGDILLMPTATNPTFNNGSEGENGYSSSFKKENEIAKPGFYKVYLDDNKVDVELSCSKRVGFHKYTFDEEDTVNVILDLVHRDVLRESDIIKIGDNKIEGKRISSAWAKEQHIYFAIEFSQPIQNMYGQVRNKKDYFVDSDAKDPLQKAIFGFRLDKSKELLVKVAISAVSTEGAWKNMEAEIPHWDFEKVKNEAKEEWNKELGKIKVEGGTESQKTIFYSALYHSMLAPNLYSDVDGKYRGRDLQIHEADGFDYYTVFSLWDTYRGEHPLLTIIDEKRTNDFIKTMLKQYEEGGALPVWELGANETMCMIGYHSIPVIADAYMKGIRNFDAELAFEAMKHSANINHLGISEYKTFGYIPANLEHESVSKTLEYAYDDWCIAQMAKELGKTEDYEYYIKRAQFYINIIDEDGFARPKMNGSWLYPFDPKEVNIHYTEANSWQYSFYAPQDVSGLMKMKGGKEKFIENLDQLFAESTETTGREQADITGLIGQYAHGNEPSHHIAYLYAYAGEPWKTQEITRRIMDELYSNQTDGYCGNEDCGQMSAWYVLSAMGFYPVCPGSNEYVIGSPIFDKVTIQLENGEEFVIEAKNNSKENKYIQSCTLNGNEYQKSFITHEDILKGGTLSFEMADEPNKEWCSNKGFPVSEIEAEMNF